MKSITELRKGLVCLVPKDGKPGMTCHEYSVCDCTVLDLLEDWERMQEALEEIRYMRHQDVQAEMKKGKFRDWKDVARIALDALKFKKV